jgi:hypothetical protein
MAPNNQYSMRLDTIGASCAMGPGGPLQPYLNMENTSRKSRSTFFKYFVMAIPPMAWLVVLAGTAVSVGWALLWYYEVPPSSWADSDMQWASLFILFGTVVGSVYAAGVTKYTEGQRGFKDSMSAVATTTNFVLGSMVPCRIDMAALLSNAETKAKVEGALYRLVHYTRAQPYAVKYTFRGDLEPSRLPLPFDLQSELQAYDTNTVDGTTKLILEAVSTLQCFGMFNREISMNFDPQNDLSGGVQRINNALNVGIPPYERGITIITVSLFLVWNFMYGYPFYGWGSIAIHFAISFLVGGTLMSSHYVKNPFLASKKSAKEVHMLCAVEISKDAHDTARQTDQFYVNHLRKFGYDVDFTTGALVRCKTASGF